MDISKYTFSLLFLLACIPSVAGLDFSLSTPQEAALNSSFSVNIISNITETNDVKIYVQNTEKKIISEIENQGWKNSFYYIKAIFPKQTLFTLRIVRAADNAEICAKLRATATQKASAEVCNPIIILSSFSDSKSSSTPSLSVNRDDNAEDKDTDEKISSSEIKPTRENSDTNEIKTSKESSLLSYREAPAVSPINAAIPEKIHLNPKKNSFLSAKESIFITKHERVRLFLVYGFTLFTIVLLILLAWKKL